MTCCETSETKPRGATRDTVLRDARGLRLSGANPTALVLYERAIAASSCWQGGAVELAAQAIESAPNFVMAHVLLAHGTVGSRDPARVRSARPIIARAMTMRTNEDERLHLAGLAAASDDRYELAQAHLARVLERSPRDLLALQTAHALDHLIGSPERTLGRIESVLDAWQGDVPGRHSVLAMHASALVETGETARAERRAEMALALEPGDARAHHAMAHVFETAGRADAGVHWMASHASAWRTGSVVATHMWWHLALFHLARGDTGSALATYDTEVRAQRSAELSDLIDATSLLWRLQLRDVDVGTRWIELAAAWDAHIDDAFCSFSDVHAMLAFVGARDGERANRLQLALSRAQSRTQSHMQPNPQPNPTRYGETTRRLGLPACRALLAYGRGDDALAVTLLASLPPLAYRLGGSHAQRDVLHLTLLHAIDRLRRPAARRGRISRQASVDASTRLVDDSF